jgi:hypothetical protein
MEDDRSFEFMGCINILKSTGRKALGLRDLRVVLSEISDESLFHHTCQYFLGGHILEYANDFAQWVGESLEERALSEHLSTVDPFDLKDIGSLRRELTGIIDRYLELFPEPRNALPGNEFCFTETISITFHVGIRASNLAEFHAAIRHVNPASIYYHFYEARVRHGTDDFSTWFEDILEKKDLAEAIRAIDPFMHAIEGIRTRIVEAVERRIRRDIEGVMDQ